MAEHGINVCDLVVAHDMCVGCGICSGICPTENIPMSFNERGEYIPLDQDRCLDKCTLCLDACPFLDHVDDEHSLGEKQFGGSSDVKHHQLVGYYQGTYVGYAAEGDYRANGASGGLATWFLARLLSKGIVDRVACVAPDMGEGNLFKFAVFESIDEIVRSSKSAYYPVEMSGIIREILSEKARYIVIGLPCFLKGLRLAAAKNRRLRERIVMLAGLTCGQTKSAGYADYLVRRAGATADSLESVSFRDKDVTKPATELVFHARDDKGSHRLSWGEYGDVWESGQFKVRACDFCDDAFAEVADIVFMDAWLPGYHQDGRGTSIVVSRSAEADSVLTTANVEGAVALQPLPIDDVVNSQAGVVRQKTTMLAHRLWLADRSGQRRPRKRVIARRPGLYTRQFIQVLENLRTASHAGMIKQKSAGEGLTVYDEVINKPMARLKTLRRVGYVMHIGRSLIRRLLATARRGASE